MEAKVVPKYLIGTDEIAFMSTLASSSGLFSPKGAFTGPRGAHFELPCSPFGPQFQYPTAELHYSQCIFGMQSSSHRSYNELCCPQLVSHSSEHYFGFNVHHSLFALSDHLLHFGLWSPFSKFPLIRVRNTRTYNQGIAKQLSPITYPIQLSRR